MAERTSSDRSLDHHKMESTYSVDFYIAEAKCGTTSTITFTSMSIVQTQIKSD